ncbi:hypothetical protein, partial [Halalkalibacter lacteus]|uniref:hypothetical protein n=1 Tax=Halalkalibacter lacteus TaxID=3090663 RepID=UPI002FC65140
ITDLKDGSGSADCFEYKKKGKVRPFFITTFLCNSKEGNRSSHCAPVMRNPLITDLKDGSGSADCFEYKKKGKVRPFFLYS